MTELTHVISSTPLTEESDAAVEQRCPREVLGLSCIVAQYACLCELVEACRVETVKGLRGGTAVVNLCMTLRQNKADPQAVMAGIDLTGYRADYQASRQAVTASFNMRMPQNAGLMTFVRETGV
jgi:hypothetical protein